MTVQAEVVFPVALSDIYPASAKQLYIDTYKQSWDTSVEGRVDGLSRESCASRDAWGAVMREYSQNQVTHKWYHNGDPNAGAKTSAGKRSFLGTVKGLFKR